MSLKKPSSPNLCLFPELSVYLMDEVLREFYFTISSFSCSSWWISAYFAIIFWSIWLITCMFDCFLFKMLILDINTKLFTGSTCILLALYYLWLWMSSSMTLDSSLWLLREVLFIIFMSLLLSIDLMETSEFEVWSYSDSLESSKSSFLELLHLL